MITSFQDEVLAHRPLMMMRARKFSGNPAAAEDIVQEALVNALRAEHQFEQGTNLRAWLTTIVRNVWLSTLRRDRIRTFFVADDANDVEGSGSAETCTRIREIRAAIARLPAHQRRAVLLAAEGHSYEDMAVMEGCSEGTIRSRVHRARTQLREELGGVS